MTTFRIRKEKKSMAFVRMSLGYAIFMALHVVSSVTGIAGTWTVDNHGELATYCLADVTYMRRLGLEFRSYTPEWYGDGMRIFAYKHDLPFWDKRDLTWALVDRPQFVDAGYLTAAVRDACAKWAKVSSLTFREVSPAAKPDMRIKVDRDLDCLAATPNTGYVRQDRNGATLLFKDSDCYQNRSHKYWCNLRFLALYIVGRALGLHSSRDISAVMFRHPRTSLHHPGLHSTQEPQLGQDDIDSIQAKYEPPSRSGRETRTYGGNSPSASNSSNSPSLGHPRYPGPGSFYGQGSTTNQFGRIQAGYGPPLGSGKTTQTYAGQKQPESSSSDSSSSSSSSG